MTVREQVAHDLDTLGDEELAYVARLVESLRTRPADAPVPSFDPAVFGPLYRECADEDRVLAELGLDEWSRGLEEEDRA